MLKMTGQIHENLLRSFHGSVSEFFEAGRLACLKEAYEIIKVLDDTTAEKKVALAKVLNVFMNQIWILDHSKKERIENEKKFVEAVKQYCHAH